MAKKMSAKKIMEARINRAVVGFVIPMMAIPKMCKAMEEAIAAGFSDDEIKSIVATWPGVVESA
jgi:Pyruvate/2-oxoacid:ferredoxin oxidoreductase gamma subunit